MTEPRTQAAGGLWRLPVNARSHTSPLSPNRQRDQDCSFGLTRDTVHFIDQRGD